VVVKQRGAVVLDVLLPRRRPYALEHATLAVAFGCACEGAADSLDVTLYADALEVRSAQVRITDKIVKGPDTALPASVALPGVSGAQADSAVPLSLTLDAQALANFTCAGPAGAYCALYITAVPGSGSAARLALLSEVLLLWALPKARFAAAAARAGGAALPVPRLVVTAVRPGARPGRGEDCVYTVSQQARAPLPARAARRRPRRRARPRVRALRRARGRRRRRGRARRRRHAAQHRRHAARAGAPRGAG
jgi:hypothetical protein